MSIEDPASWSWELSAADELLIESMDERTRAAVERYVTSRMPSAHDADHCPVCGAPVVDGEAVIYGIAPVPKGAL